MIDPQCLREKNDFFLFFLNKNVLYIFKCVLLQIGDEDEIVAGAFMLGFHIDVTTSTYLVSIASVTTIIVSASLGFNPF